MKTFNRAKKTKSIVVLLTLLFVCIMAAMSGACKISDLPDSGNDNPPGNPDYGTLTLSLPEFTPEDGENILFSDYDGRKIKTVFSNPKYSGEKLEWKVEETFSESVKINDGIISAYGDFSTPAVVKVKAKSEHFEAELDLTVKNFEGTYKGNRLFLNEKAERLLNEQQEISPDKKIETGGIIFIGDDYFDTEYFSNFYSVYEEKKAKAFGISGTTASQWQYLAEKLVYPFLPEYVAIHIGMNDFSEGKPVVNDLSSLLSSIRSRLPDARIFCFATEPKPNGNNAAIESNNAAIQNIISHFDNISYIDSSAWCKKDGIADENFFRDGITPELKNYSYYVNALTNEGVVLSESAASFIPSDLTEISKDAVASSSEKMYGSVPSPNNKTRARIQLNYPLKENSIIRFVGDSDLFKWAVVTFENDKRTDPFDSSWSTADNWKGDENRLTYRMNGNLYATLTIAYNDDRSIPTDILNDIYSMFAIYGDFGEKEAPLTEREVRSVNHRGYNTVAPENTLSAFRLSAEKGFDTVECDVSFTKDNVPVILHDNTVDRTSNGSGTIGSFTFDEVRTLDFGSWKSSVYSGEKIPSLEEFANLCKSLGLHAYIELKTEGTTAEQVKIAYDTIKTAGIENNVTWISFGEDLLQAVKNLDPTARLGFVVNSIGDSAINGYYNLYNGQNEVFIDCNVSNLNDRTISLLKSMNIRLEVWTVNSPAVIAGLDKYVSGFTSNSINARDVLKKLTADRREVSLSTTAEHGTISLPSKKVLDGERVTIELIPDNGYLLSSLLLNGKNVVSLVENDSITFTADGDTEIKAIFEDKSDFVTVTYRIGDFSEEKIVKKGSTYTYAKTPQKADDGLTYYTFAGWFDSEDYLNEITEFVFDRDTVLYAKFDENIYSIAINFTSVDIDTTFGEQLTAVTDYKGEITWKKVSGDDCISVTKDGFITTSAAGKATIGLFVLGEQKASCDVTARVCDSTLIKDFSGERTNVYHNITNGTRALLQSKSRFCAGAKITLKSQYKASYRWSVSQIYKIPAENGFLFDPGWNTSWTNQDSYVTTEDALLGIVVAIKDDANSLLPSGIENNLSSMFIIEGTFDSGYVSLSEFITDANIETIKCFGTKDAVTGGSVNNTRVSLALKIKVGKDTKIRFNVHTKKYLFAVVELQSLTSTSGSTDSGWNSTWKTEQKLTYSVKKDCYLCLTVAIPGNKKPLTQELLDQIGDFFDISYTAPETDIN